VALLSPKEIKLSAAVILLLALIAVLVTLLVMAGGAGEPRRQAGASGEEEALAEGPAAGPAGPAGEELHTFQPLIPDEFRGVFRSHWVPFRERHARWSAVQTDPYWIDPRQLVEEELEQSTDESVEAFLKELP
jgi:hypothetical protein